MIKEADPDLSTAEVWSGISEDCKELIMKMLVKNPKDRITVDDALKSSWFEKHRSFIQEIKKRYHAVLDEQTGMINKPERRRTSMMDSSQIQSLVQMQQMMSNSNMADELGVSKLDANTLVRVKGDDSSK